MKAYSLTHSYNFYRSLGGELPNKEYREICKLFNLKAVQKLLEGKRINMGANLGFLQIVQLKNAFKINRVDWGSSLKLKQSLLDAGKQLYDKETGEGEKWIVYYTEPYYYKFFWSKKNCKVRNKSVYRFIPSRGKRGAKDLLVKLLKEDELAHFNFSSVKNV